MNVNNGPGVNDEKRCPACDQTKPLTEYHRDRGRPDGRASCCADCGRARARDSYARHREQRLETVRAYQRNNAEKIRARPRGEDKRPAESRWLRRYRASCRKAGVDPIVVPFTKAEVIARYGDTCSDCGSPEWELRHQIPVGAGGVHRLENVRPRCRPCGSSKFGRTDKAIIALFRTGAADLRTSPEKP